MAQRQEPEEDVYSLEEVYSEIEKLERNRTDLRRVTGYVRKILSDKPLGLSVADVVCDAYASLLSGRRHVPKRLPFLVGVMTVAKSMISNSLKDNETVMRRRSISLNLKDTKGDDSKVKKIDIRDSTNIEMGTHYKLALRRLSEEQKALLRDDLDKALYTAKMFDSATDKELRKEYGLSQTEYDARRKRIGRQIRGWDQTKWEGEI